MRKNIYLVDFFDTIMFRRVHPEQVTKQWARTLKRKFSLILTEEELVSKRRACFASVCQHKNETVYDDAITALYNELAKCDKTFACTAEEEKFLSYARRVELAAEVGVQYPNESLIKRLIKLKEKGAKIYIASDFYFGKQELAYFLKAKGIDCSLFEDIFVSADCNATKRTGELYAHVLSCLNCDPGVVCMIGDNYVSDKKQAQLCGICSQFKPRIIYKVLTQLKRRTKYDYSSRIAKRMVRDCYRFGLPFSEYVALFFSFAERLKKHLSKDSSVVFLAREGFFLKELFELYDYLVFPNTEQTKTAYFMCSRRAISSTQIEDVRMISEIPGVTLKNYLMAAGFSDDEILHIAEHKRITEEELGLPVDSAIIAVVDDEVTEKVHKNRQALLAYADEIIGDCRRLHFVDVGWRGSMQAGLESVIGIKTHSFYLGLKGDEENSRQIQKSGLVFSEKDKLFHILSTNIQLYELLLAAPHGSAQTYVQVGDKVEVLCRWEENERNLYLQTIQQWQKYIVPVFEALSVWSSPEGHLMNDWTNANIVMRSALFADKKRLEFLHKLDTGFVWNFGKETKGLSYDRKAVKIDLSILYAPERYLRYLAKVQRLLPANNIVQYTYKIAALLYMVYTKTVLCIKAVF